jgi:hypothetical protein
VLLVLRICCKGFPGQIIGFQMTKKTDVSLSWLLVDGDMSGRVHVEPKRDRMEKIPSPDYY